MKDVFVRLRMVSLGIVMLIPLIGSAQMVIHYRWDKSNLDSLYLSNPQYLSMLDSLLRLNSASYIDTLTVVAFASPEGHPLYNQRLSQRRANTLRNYLIERYPMLPPNRIVTQARGENWEGLLKLVQEDPLLPSRNKVLQILQSPADDIARQEALTLLDGGTTYYRYILPRYYRYLRHGSFLLITYLPHQLRELEVKPPITPQLSASILPLPVLQQRETVVDVPASLLIHYPIALRTNLLYNAVGALNLGLELPFGKQKHWSWIVDGAYGYWRSSRNQYALQTLEYGTELRYWLSVPFALKAKNSAWATPLKGFNLGLYGRYWQRYDVQWVDGVQGDGSWSAGLTAGYALPVGRRLALEASLGAGWFDTSEYRHYHQPEYDEIDTGHLMWQQTGTWSGWTLTKLRLSLVWLLQTRTDKKGENSR